MTDNFEKDIDGSSKEVHGEQQPVITLTRRQIEEDWYTLHQALKRKEQEYEDLQKEAENWEQLVKHADKQIEDLETALEDIHDLLKEYEKSYGSNTHIERAMRIYEELDYENRLE